MSVNKSFGERITLPDRPTCVIGIDPGENSGAICVVRFIPHQESGGIQAFRMCHSMPPSLPEIRRLLLSSKNYQTRTGIDRIEDEDYFVFLESFKGWHFPPHFQGPALKGYVSRIIKVQVHLGQLTGLLAGIRVAYHPVTPQAWQKRLGCLTKGDKHVTKAAAQRRFPKMKVTLKNADAILIAHYGCLWQLGTK